jgi:hypothetical protein
MADVVETATAMMAKQNNTIPHGRTVGVSAIKLGPLNNRIPMMTLSHAKYHWGCCECSNTLFSSGTFSTVCLTLVLE